MHIKYTIKMFCIQKKKNVCREQQVLFINKVEYGIEGSLHILSFVMNKK
jgi:hypothetical protein